MSRIFKDGDIVTWVPNTDEDLDGYDYFKVDGDQIKMVLMNDLHGGQQLCSDPGCIQLVTKSLIREHMQQTKENLAYWKAQHKKTKQMFKGFA